MNKLCTVCNLSEDTRPYGKGGSLICYTCAMATPERQAEATRQLHARFAKLDGQPFVISADKPPEALTAENAHSGVALFIPTDPSAPKN